MDCSNTLRRIMKVRSTKLHHGRISLWMILLTVLVVALMYINSTVMGDVPAASTETYSSSLVSKSTNRGAEDNSASAVIHTDKNKDGEGTIVGSSGGAWTAETHLQQYGFNVDAGLVRVLEASCREVENTRNAPDSQWSAHPSRDSPIGGLWRPPAIVDCKVLELGSGVGVYVDALKKDNAKRKRKVFGVEPNRMGGVYERSNGPRQLTVDIMKAENPELLAQTIRREQLGGDTAFDVLVSIEVCEHMPLDRHTHATAFLAALARPGTKLIFGAAHPGQSGTGHIGNRPKREWENILKSVGFIKDLQQTVELSHELDEYNHKVNTQVYYYKPTEQP